MKNKILSLIAVGLIITACETTDKKNNGMAGEGGAMGGAPGSYEDFKVNVADRVFFDLDKSTLTTEGKAILDRQSGWLAKYPSVSLIIEGHCDIRGTREYNLALGERRAKSVKDYLATKGVNSSRIHTVSYGKERPEFQGDSEDVHSKNRRGVTVIQ